MKGVYREKSGTFTRPDVAGTGERVSGIDRVDSEYEG
jgi:hypothetical protein